MVASAYDILGIGNPFYDRFAFVSDEFLKQHHIIKGDTTVILDRVDLEKSWEKAPQKEACYVGKLGGSCANVIKVLTRLGHRCALSGVIGSDELGTSLLARLKEIGIASLISKGKNGTGLVNCFVTPDRQRTMQTFLGSASELAEDKVKKEHFKNVKHVHLEGYLLCYDDVMEKGIEFAKQQNATISVDLASSFVVKKYLKRFEKCISQVNFVFGNMQEILALRPSRTLKEAVESFGIDQTVVATMGPDGCLVKEKGTKQAVHYTALKVPQSEVVDTTGAGDYFDGGFLHGMFSGKSIPESVEMANLTATSVIRQLGAELPEDEWSKLIHKIAKISYS